MTVFVHPQGICESRNVGAGTRVWAFAHVLPGATIGADCNICDHVFVENDVLVGDRVTIKCGVQLWDGLRLEDEVFVGPNVTFSNDRYPRSKVYPREFLKTIVRRGASIGANATILPGIEIGEQAMVAAGSVVTKSVPARVLVQGNPARPSRFLDAEMIDASTCNTANGPYVVMPGIELHRLVADRDGSGPVVIPDFAKQCAFEPRCFLLLTDTADGGLKHGRAYTETTQFIVLISGSVTGLVDNAQMRRAVRLSHQGEALLLPPATWVGFLDFAPGTVLGAFTSRGHDTADCVPDYGEFCRKFG